VDGFQARIGKRESAGGGSVDKKIQSCVYQLLLKIHGWWSERRFGELKADSLGETLPARIDNVRLIEGIIRTVFQTWRHAQKSLKGKGRV